MDTKRPSVGDLSKHPLPGLLFSLHRERLTATLALCTDTLERRVHFRNGRVVAVITPAAIDACARILLDLGIVSQECYAQALMVANETGRSHIEVLEEMGAVTDGQLARARGQQSYETMMRMFRLRGAEFAVQVREHEFGRRFENGGIHPRRIIFHGIRAAYDLERLREEMGDWLDDATFRVNRDEVANVADYDFDAESRGIFDRLRDDCTIEMLGESELSARQVLYTLMATDALEVCVGASAVTPGRKIATPAPASRRDVVGPGSYRFSGKTVPAHARRERLMSRSSSSVPPTAAARPTGPTLRETIERTAQSLDRLSYFELLGVKDDAGDAQIETAYDMQKRTFDPSDLKMLGLEELVPVVARILVRLDRAYDILSNPTLRGAYLRSMRGQGSGSGSHVGRVRKRTPERGA